MSLVTSCPTCSTRFRIVPDQLKVSEGWVRCGTCNEVFDASKRLEDPEADAARGRPNVPVLVETFDPPESPAPALPGSNESQHHSIPDFDLSVPALGAAELEATPNTSAHTPEAATAPAVEPLLHPTDEPASVSEPEVLATPFDVDRQDPSAPSLDIDEEALEPQFVRQAKRAAFWQKTWVRTMLLLVALGLGIALAVQYIVQERDRLAGRNPQAHQMVSRVCVLMQCEISALRDPDAIAIESSRFQKQIGVDGGAEVYQLVVQLRNRADHAVAWPDLELSLTGNGDQPLVRVVFGSGQYAPKDRTDLQGGQEHTANLLVKLDPNASGGRISGYRLLAFYR